MVHSDQSGIEMAFIEYYKKLWTSPSVRIADLIDAVPCDLPYISDTEAFNLIHEITKDEVFSTIHDLPPGKSPGPDGFNVEFFSQFLACH